MSTAFMSVFHLQALLKQPLERYLSDLAQPDSILGDQGYLVPLVQRGTELNLARTVLPLYLTADECRTDLQRTAKRVRVAFPSLLRQVAAHEDLVGALFVSRDTSGLYVFQTTYYTMDGWHQLLIHNGFDGCAISISLRGKGLVTVIRPDVDEALNDGILITCINNVIGNMFYRDQPRELQKLAGKVTGQIPSLWFPPRPPNALESWRARIDVEDARIWQAVARRMAFSRQIGAVKRTQGLPIHDPDREHVVRASRRQLGAALGLETPLVEDLMGLLLDHSKQVQQ